jgi:hypothetical protein
VAEGLATQGDGGRRGVSSGRGGPAVGSGASSPAATRPWRVPVAFVAAAGDDRADAARAGSRSRRRPWMAIH